MGALASSVSDFIAVNPCVVASVPAPSPTRGLVEALAASGRRTVVLHVPHADHGPLVGASLIVALRPAAQRRLVEARASGSAASRSPPRRHVEFAVTGPPPPRGSAGGVGMVRHRARRSPASATDLPELLGRADKALYEERRRLRGGGTVAPGLGDDPAR